MHALYLARIVTPLPPYGPDKNSGRPAFSLAQWNLRHGSSPIERDRAFDGVFFSFLGMPELLRAGLRRARAAGHDAIPRRGHVVWCPETMTPGERPPTHATQARPTTAGANTRDWPARVGGRLRHSGIRGAVARTFAWLD